MRKKCVQHSINIYEYIVSINKFMTRNRKFDRGQQYML